jgi:hypothetical protein
VFTAYIILTLLAAAALTFSATADFVRYKKVMINMARAGVPESWLIRLGIAKAAGAIGLVVGIVIPPIGVAAAIGVILFFVGAIITHIRARWFSFGFPATYLLLGVGVLVMGLVRPWGGFPFRMPWLTSGRCCAETAVLPDATVVR